MKVHRADIIALLKAAAPVTEIVGAGDAAKIYNGIAPPSAVLPYITISLNSQKRPQSHDQRDNANRRKADRCEWTVSCCGTDGDVVADLAEAVDNALDGKTTATNTAVILFDDATEHTNVKQDNSGAVYDQIDITLVTRNRPIDS